MNKLIFGVRPHIKAKMNFTAIIHTVNQELTYFLQLFDRGKQPHTQTCSYCSHKFRPCPASDVNYIS